MCFFQYIKFLTCFRFSVFQLYLQVKNVRLSTLKEKYKRFYTIK